MSTGPGPVPAIDELVSRIGPGVQAVLDAARHAPTQLTCAVCLWCEFLDAELDTPGFLRDRVAPAVTTVDGTALCALHMEDFQRNRDPFIAAESIVRVGNPEAFARRSGVLGR